MWDRQVRFLFWNASSFSYLADRCFILHLLTIQRIGCFTNKEYFTGISNLVCSWVLGAMTLLSAQSPQRFTTELSQRLSWCEPWGSAFSATRWAGLGDKCCKFLQAVFIFWQFAIHGEQLVLTSYGAASRAGHSQELQHKHCSTLPKHGCINSHRNNLI